MTVSLRRPLRPIRPGTGSHPGRYRGDRHNIDAYLAWLAACRACGCRRCTED